MSRSQDPGVGGVVAFAPNDAGAFGPFGRNPPSETTRKDLRLITKRQRYNTYVRIEECIQDGPGQMVQ